MWFKRGLHVGTRRRTLGVCLSGGGCFRPGAGEGGSPSLSSPARVNLPWALGRIPLPLLPYIAPLGIVRARFDRVIHSIQYLHTWWSTAHRARSEQMSMPPRNAAEAKLFFMNQFMKESLVTALRLSTQRADDTHTMESRELALTFPSLPPLRWRRWSTWGGDPSWKRSLCG